jgi:ubiquinone biosynthesis protein UbiJ
LFFADGPFTAAADGRFPRIFAPLHILSRISSRFRITLRPMIPHTFSAFVNHLLRQQSWASDRLRAHAGERIRIQLPAAFPLPFASKPFLTDVNLQVSESGLIAAGSNEVDADLVVTVKPAAMPMFLVHHPDVLKHVDLSGKASLAAVISDLVTRLQWDVEEDLSRVVGDIAAHRIATAGRDFFAWQRDAAHRTAENVADYLTDENPMLARRTDIDQFARDLQTLAQDLDRIETRIKALTHPASPG